VSVSLSELAIIYLAVYELKEGSALPMVGRETTVYGSAHRLCGNDNLYAFKNEALVYGGIVKAI
jgi:hypothetical protein